MKTTIALLSLLFSGCASTTLYSPRTGRILARFQADMTRQHYAGSGVVWDAETVNHSKATLAGGSAVAKGIQSTATLATSIGTAVATSGVIK